MTNLWTCLFAHGLLCDCCDTFILLKGRWPGSTSLTCSGWPQRIIWHFRMERNSFALTNWSWTETTVLEKTAFRRLIEMKCISEARMRYKIFLKSFLGTQRRQGCYQSGNHKEMPKCITQAERRKSLTRAEQTGKWDFFLSPLFRLFQGSAKRFAIFPSHSIFI